MITPRWYLLRYHSEQNRLIYSPHRFNSVPAGRRSGKTEIIGKRKIVEKAIQGTAFNDANFFVGAPTRDQAKRIYWNDLKRLVPRDLLLCEPNESQLIISLVNMSSIYVVGMDKPQRIEGTPWDGGVLDEFGNMKKETFQEHVRASLSDRKGWCDFIGVPEGRNHYYELDQKAQADTTGEWGHFHWISADILDPEEIVAAKADLDELTYLQEYEASFINFQGRTYYAFTDRNKARITYNKKQPLIIALDFNVAPGIAVIMQEKQLQDLDSGTPLVGETATCVIGQVHIPRNSNTILVCNKLVNDWKDHQAGIYVYGDATGGAPKTSGVAGTDWDLAKKVFQRFGDRVIYRVPRGNPSERDRVNAVNSRCRTLEGKRRLYVDPGKASMVIKDFEGVQCIEGGSGEINKLINPELTHLTDAIGYYIHREFPVRKDMSGIVGLKEGGTGYIDIGRG